MLILPKQIGFTAQCPERLCGHLPNPSGQKLAEKAQAHFQLCCNHFLIVCQNSVQYKNYIQYLMLYSMSQL
jgi:hypothetical protein